MHLLRRQCFPLVSGGMRKTYALQYPGVLAVWKALEDAHERGFHHLEFMDVGLPFRRHGYRDFVLRFGGNKAVPDVGSASVGLG